MYVSVHAHASVFARMLAHACVHMRAHLRARGRARMHAHTPLTVRAELHLLLLSLDHSSYSTSRLSATGCRTSCPVYSMMTASLGMS